MTHLQASLGADYFVVDLDLLGIFMYYLRSCFSHVIS
jgi:hypothetical protein